MEIEEEFSALVGFIEGESGDETGRRVEECDEVDEVAG